MTADPVLSHLRVWRVGKQPRRSVHLFKIRADMLGEVLLRVLPGFHKLPVPAKLNVLLQAKLKLEPVLQRPSTSAPRAIANPPPGTALTSSFFIIGRCSAHQAKHSCVLLLLKLSSTRWHCTKTSKSTNSSMPFSRASALALSPYPHLSR